MLGKPLPLLAAFLLTQKCYGQELSCDIPKDTEEGAYSFLLEEGTLFYYCSDEVKDLKVSACRNGNWAPPIEENCMKSGNRLLSAYKGDNITKRLRRSPNVGKFESLKRREKVQRKIRAGLLATKIEHNTPTIVRVHPGNRGFLLCRIENLGTNSVLWSKLGRVLSIDTLRITDDARFLPSHDEATRTWTLEVKDIRPIDEGEYVCQVNTRPPLKHFVSLQVIPHGVPLLPPVTDKSRFDEMDKIKINISSIWDEVNRLSQWISSHEKVDHHHHHYNNDDQQNHHKNDTLEMDDHSNHTHTIGHHHNDNNFHQGEHSHDEHGEHHQHDDNHSHNSDRSHDEHMQHHHHHDEHMQHHHHHDDSHDHEHAHHDHRQSHDDQSHDDDNIDEENNSDEEKSSGNPQNYGNHHHHHQHGRQSHGHHSKHSRNGHRHNHHHNKIGDRSDENDSDEKSVQNRGGLTFRTPGIGGHKFDLTRQYDENKILVVGFCDMKPNRELPESKIRGNITVLQRKYGKGPIYYKITLEGFKGSMSETSHTHGFHIHEKAILDEGLCNSAGAHYNPENQAHGSLTSIERHLGDFGNIIVDSYGKVTEYELVDHWNNISSIFGKTFVVHELPDDLGKGGNAVSLANGNAGKRLACCTIHSGTETSIRFNG